MTGTHRLHGLVAPIAAALATAAVFTVALWVQHARETWPFAPPATAHAEAAGPGMASPMPSADTHGRVGIEAEALRSLDVRVETVGYTSLTETVRAVATVAFDESRISHVHTRVAGWVEQLDVNTTGEIVKAGQPLARIFSQELLSSQAEYLAARTSTTALGISSAVVESGRTRLGVFGMTPDEIAAIERTGEPRRLVTVVAPLGGVVIDRGVTVGTAVDPSTRLLTIADLSRVWIFAELPEASIRAVQVGTRALLDFPASGRPPFPARVEFVYPVLTERTRTLRVRLAAANPAGALKPGLYGTATFESAGRKTLTVPRDAVVDTGLQQHVFVAIADRFEPRAVTLGTRVTGRVEVLEGLTEGERIVSSGVFLLDSESRLRATGGTGGHAHGTMPASEKPVARPAEDPHEGHAAPPPNPHQGHEE